MLRLAIYQPDIPQNTGTMLRLSACLGVPVEIIEPAAFDVSDRNLRRSGMDYLHHATIARHISWRAFEAWRREAGARLILATTRGAIPYADFAYRADDIVVWGFSLGTGVAVALAAERPIGKLILEAPYTSIVDVAASHFRFMPVPEYAICGNAAVVF